MAAASLVVRFIGFLYRIPLTRVVGDEGFAYYFAAYSIYTFAIALSSGTLPAALSKLTSERIARGHYYNAHNMFKTAMWFGAILGGLSGLVMFVFAGQFAALINAPAAVNAIRTLAPTVLFVALLAVYRGYFQGMKTAIPTAISQVVEQIVKIIFTLLLVYLLMDATNMQPAIAGATAGTGIAAVAGLFVVIAIYAKSRKQILSNMKKDHPDKRTSSAQRYKAESKLQQVVAILQTALPMVLGMALLSASNLLDLRMPMSRMALSGAFTESEARALLGQFTSKFLLLTTLPISLSVALSAAVIPEITSANITLGAQAVRNKINMAARLSMMISIPSAVGLAILAYPVIALLFPSHPDGGWLLQYGAISIVFIALSHVLQGALQGLGHVKLPVIATLVGVIIKIPLNYVLIAIPGINILGLVISNIVCFMVVAAINLYFLYSRTKIFPALASAIIKPSIAALGMGMVCYVVYASFYFYLSNTVSTILAIGAGGASYLFFMLLIGGFRKSDIDAMPIPAKIKKYLYM